MSLYLVIPYICGANFVLADTERWGATLVSRRGGTVASATYALAVHDVGMHRHVQHFRAWRDSASTRAAGRPAAISQLQYLTYYR